MLQDRSRDYARILGLTWPILIGQLALIANGVIDTVMTSRFSATDLAALALGGSIYISVFVGLNGVLQALGPTVGQLFGARRFDAIGAEIKQGVWLAIFLSCIGGVLLAFPQLLLSFAHPSRELEVKAIAYLRTLGLALPATLGFAIYSALNNAVSRPKMIMLIYVVALLFKLPLNALFIFGGWGIPAFGGPGCAIATALISWGTLVAGWTILRTVPFYRTFRLFGTGFVMPRWAEQWALLRLGIPMGLSYLIEVSAFAFMAIFIARLGDTVVAGHQITANFGTVLYMLPMAIAKATGTLVAQAVGAGDLRGARRIGFSGVVASGLLSSILGTAIWIMRDTIVRAYTPNEAIIAATVPLFFYIGFYQVFDAVQVTIGFILRAYKVSAIPTVIYAIALWGVGLAGGYVLGLDPLGWMPAATHGASGFWLSYSLSLALVAGGLLWYLGKVQRDAAKRAA